MFRPVLFVFVLSCLLGWAAQPCFAARLDAGVFSAELPAGWTVTRDDEMTTFTESRGQVELMVILKKYDNRGIEDIVAEMAGQTPVHFLSDSIYIYEDSSGGRGWSMRAADGAFADVSANMAYTDIRAFLAGLKAAEGEKSLAEIFATLTASKEAAEWLSYETPPFAKADADTGASEDGTPYEHKSFTAVLPEGWSASERGDAVEFFSGAKDAFVIVRVIYLASEDDKAFAAWAAQQAKAAGGANINVSEGVVEFTTAKGANGMFTQFGAKCLFLLFGGESPQIGNLIKSIGLAD